MTYKFFHLRAVDPDYPQASDSDLLLATGGLTVAYLTTKKDVLVNVAKCREYPILDERLLSLRNVKIDEILMDFKASTRKDKAKLEAVRKQLEYAYARRVHTYERFCYAAGRREAVKAFIDQGPLEILPLEHPVSWTIADWIANSLWPAGTEALGYQGADMGFRIDIWRDTRGRWTSDFQPADGIVSSLGERSASAFAG